MELSKLMTIFATKGRTSALAKASAAAQAKASRVELRGLSGSSAAMAIASMPRRKEPLLVVADSLDDAGYLYHDLSRLMGEEAVSMFPSGYRRGIKYGRVDPPSQIMRIETLNRWHDDERLRAVVSYPEAMAEKVASRKDLERHTLALAVGEQIDLDQTRRWLRENGFEEVDYVFEPGHFAIRGSILDVFGFSSELPYRIDLFGDDIESIRIFNVETQLSEQKIESVSITANTDGESEGDSQSVLDFAGAETMAIVVGAAGLAARVREVTQESFSTSALLADEGDASAMKNLVDADRFDACWQAMGKIHITAGAARDAGEMASDETAEEMGEGKTTIRTSRGNVTVDFHCSPQGLYHKNFDLIADSFHHLLAGGYKLYILTDSANQADRLKAIFADRGDNIPFEPVYTTLHQGFVDHDTRACFFTDHQIFDRFHKYTLKGDRARSGKVALSLKELASIEPGDYVVHVDHGVGKFGGLLRTQVNGSTQEMIKLIYKNNDCIFVSIHALHKLAKYRGKEGVEPTINKLGSGAWNRLKEKTKDKLKDIARDLIRLYAARKDEKGFSFSPDSYLQHELEASFVYEDTPDQTTATAAVKKDMESPRPMDRLICGDVGFGKTEVAIRAAFKAATDGKQVAVLVPTTVLAYQHFNTFRERLADFPVRVEYLSRARTAKQTKQILADLEAGKIDILIGTHRIVGKDVKFKDLGLLVIDEEQKFGVAVKEKLKQLKVNVDTLTMSATPIPRTLQFSLMGARDLSNINTPPPNRYPIVTSVNSLSDDILSEAINFELSRNGQAFIINNRIEGLYDIEAMVKRVVPDARTLVAHGQLPPEQLEKAIIDFANHDYDVLIATTIIESGIDMPNVNTIIVNNAQNFGLSELHQLRGRVGRSSRKAFCYLMVPPGLPLTPVARRRLQAIESFSDLGSGIHIAMQDLDIRGAGNLLGAEQSGFIADLGYETYQKILKEAVTELRTEEFSDTFTSEEPAEEQEFVADCLIESDMELLLPADYVPQESERIALYRKLDELDREMDLEEFRSNLVDRFGPIPAVTEELMQVPRLRRLGRQLGIEKISLKQGQMYLYFVDESNKAYYQSPMFGRLLTYLQQNPLRVKIRERNGRNSFAIAQVGKVSEAVKILAGIHTLPVS